MSKIDEGLEVWEKPLERPWEQIKENEKGLIFKSKFSIQKDIKFRIKKYQPIKRPLALVRKTILVLDASSNSFKPDKKFNRWALLLESAEFFAEKFLSASPFNFLSIFATFGEKLLLLSNFSNDIFHTKNNLKNIKDKSFGGEFLFYNTIFCCFQKLSENYVNFEQKEIFLFVSSRSTFDRANKILMKNISSFSIKISVAVLNCEVFAFKAVSVSSGGRFGVFKSKEEFKKLIKYFIFPFEINTINMKQNNENNQKIDENMIKIKNENFVKKRKIDDINSKENNWIYVGFPLKDIVDCSSCFCHNKKPNDKIKHFECIKCYSRLCERILICPICNLMNTSYINLMRVYHFNLPLQNFTVEKMEKKSEIKKLNCRGCGDKMGQNDLLTKCPKCKMVFCVHCDKFVHEKLFSCPSCS